MDIFNIETKKDRTVTSIKLSLIYIFASVIWIFIYEKIVEVFSKEQLDILKDMGCQYGQGYFLARPMSSEDLIKG